MHHSDPLPRSAIVDCRSRPTLVAAPRSRFEIELEDHLTRREAERTLRAAIAWGRYAELFSYDAKSRRFTSHQ